LVEVLPIILGILFGLAFTSLPPVKRFQKRLGKWVFIKVHGEAAWEIWQAGEKHNGN